MQLKDPDSLQVSRALSEIQDDGKVAVVLYYSATNSFGDRVSNIYTFKDKGYSKGECPDDYKGETIRS